MPQITIDIPTAAMATRIVDALCAYGAYQAQIINPATQLLEDNPVTKAQYARKLIKDMLKDVVLRQESIAAARSVQDSISPVDLDVT